MRTRRRLTLSGLCRASATAAKTSGCLPVRAETEKTAHSSKTPDAAAFAAACSRADICCSRRQCTLRRHSFLKRPGCRDQLIVQRFRHAVNARYHGVQRRPQIRSLAPKAWVSSQGISQQCAWVHVASGERLFLAQTAESPNGVFNLCVVDDASFKDVEASVAFKANNGKNDQGASVRLAIRRRRQVLHRSVRSSRRQFPGLQGRCRKANPAGDQEDFESPGRANGAL